MGGFAVSGASVVCGVGVAPGLAAREFHFAGLGPSVTAEGQDGALWGGSLARVIRVFQAVSQGQAVGRCSVRRRAEVAIRAGTAMSLRRTVAVVARARSGAANRRFTHVHPSGLPLTYAPGWIGGRFGFYPGASHPAVTSDARPGGDGPSNTCPGYVIDDTADL